MRHKRKIKEYGNWLPVNKNLGLAYLAKSLEETLKTVVIDTAKTLTKRYYIPFNLKAFVGNHPENKNFITVGWKINAVYCGSDLGYCWEALKDWLTQLYFAIFRRHNV